MLLIRASSTCRKFVAWALLLWAGSVWSAGPTVSELDDVFAIKLLAFEQDDDDGRGGNPNLAEDATIYEGIAMLRKRVSDTDVVHIQGLWDEVTAASYDDAKDKAEIVSGATGYNPGRWGLDLGWTHETQAIDVSVNAGYGQEFAYRAHNLGFGLSQTLAEGVTQWRLDVQAFNDVIRVIRWDGSQEPNAHRKTRTANIGVVQTLTPESALNLSWSHTEQSGFLATSFNSVLVDNARWIETAPDARRRDALSLRYKHALEQDAVQLGVGVYCDDWGVDAATLELRYYYELSDRVMLEPQVRFYTQTAADFFAPTFTSVQQFMTSDPDLGDFNNQSLGLLIHLFNQRLLGNDRARLDLGLNYTVRSDELNYYWLTFGAAFPL